MRIFKIYLAGARSTYPPWHIQHHNGQWYLARDRVMVCVADPANKTLVIKAGALSRKHFQRLKNLASFDDWKTSVAPTL